MIPATERQLYTLKCVGTIQKANDVESNENIPNIVSTTYTGDEIFAFSRFRRK